MMERPFALFSNSYLHLSAKSHQLQSLRQSNSNQTYRQRQQMPNAPTWRITFDPNFVKICPNSKTLGKVLHNRYRHCKSGRWNANCPYLLGPPWNAPRMPKAKKYYCPLDFTVSAAQRHSIKRMSVDFTWQYRCGREWFSGCPFLKLISCKTVCQPWWSDSVWETCSTETQARLYFEFLLTIAKPNNNNTVIAITRYTVDFHR